MRLQADLVLYIWEHTSVHPSRASGRAGGVLCPLVVFSLASSGQAWSNHEPRGTHFHLWVALRRSMKTRNDKKASPPPGQAETLFLRLLK